MYVLYTLKWTPRECAPPPLSPYRDLNPDNWTEHTLNLSCFSRQGIRQIFRIIPRIELYSRIIRYTYIPPPPLYLFVIVTVLRSRKLIVNYTID